jgi:hypothetical protein
MRRRAVYTVLIAVLVSLGAAGPAAAGGPTSVLLVAPGDGSTASLYTNDADYQSLARLLGAEQYGAVTGASEPAGAGHASGTEVTATWLIHDVSVWRVDRVYLDPAGAPWIASQVNLDGSPDIWSAPIVWHRATQGAELVALLGRLGLDGTSPAAVGSVPSQRPAASSPPARTSAPGTPGVPGPVWGLAGLALGVAVSLLALRRAATRRTDRIDVLSEDEVLSSSRG